MCSLIQVDANNDPVTDPKDPSQRVNRYVILMGLLSTCSLVSVGSC